MSAHSGTVSVLAAISRAYELLALGQSSGLEEARDICLRVVEVDPKNVNAAQILAFLSMKKGDHVSCLKWADVAWSSKEDLAPIHNLRGGALLAFNRYAEAQQAFSRGIQLDPDNLDLRLNFAHAVLLSGADVDVEEVFSGVDRVEREPPERIAAAAGIHVMTGRMEAALELLRGALGSVPGDPSMIRALARVQRACGDTTGFLRTIREHLERHPHDLLGREQYAVGLQNFGDSVSALKEFERIERTDPRHPNLATYLYYARASIELERNASEAAQDIEAVFLLAPVARCGSTFLQRIVNSAKGIIIFGENQDVSVRLPECIEWATGRLDVEMPDLDAAGGRSDLTRSWSAAGAFPGRGHEYLHRHIAHFYAVMRHYKREADTRGCRWGLKDPVSSQMEMLRRLLPRSKFVFLYRGLFDVAKSYKARGWLRSDFEVIRLAHQWNDELRKNLLLGDDRILRVRYEDLVRDPESSCSKIEQFLDLDRIDRNLFETKINRPAPAQGTGSEYSAPLPLTDEEVRLLTRFARPTLRQFGYLES